MTVISRILSDVPEMTALRRTLHAHPELSYAETRTADLVAERLTEWGVDVHRGLAGTGVVGVLKRGDGPLSIGLRADMDALPVQELNEFPHRSRSNGKMHACGHDGHTAMLLGAAKYLALYGSFNGTVVLIFQPAEEEGAGAKRMIEEGLFERFPVNAVFALHNWPTMKTGHFGVIEGPIMASTNDFRIDVTGTSSHAALPHEGRDPVFAAAQMVSSLQSVITRNKHPVDTAVLSITHLHAGEARNVIPDHAWLSGTLRTFAVDTLDLLEQRMRTIVEATALAFGCTAVLSVQRNCPPTVNSQAETQFATDVMKEIAGPDAVDVKVQPTMGGEDFAHMLMVRPGCYAFLGNGDGEHRGLQHGLGPCKLHNASYDFNDALLPIGSTYFVRLAERFLVPNP